MSDLKVLQKTEALHEARWWEPEGGGRVHCFLCPRHCHIHPGQSGFCFIRINQDGKLYNLDPVASYSSKPGTFIRAVLIQSPDCDGAPVFPAGLEVEGQVVSARKVGLGIIHETASLEILFDRIVTADGSVLPIASQVMEVDNAREACARAKSGASWPRTRRRGASRTAWAICRRLIPTAPRV